MRTALIVAVSIVLVLMSIAIVPLCLVAALMGLSGHLADTSVHENRIVGLEFLGIAALPLIADYVWVCYLLPKIRKSP